MDIGCGPGRITAALTERGVIALGVDTSPLAVRLTVSRNAAALCRDVFGRLPGEGRWTEALLMDGNIGIGGDPRRLLRRVHHLLRPGGRAWVEAEPPGAGLWQGTARTARAGHRGNSFRWATAGVNEVRSLATGTGFGARRVVEHDSRWLVELVKERRATTRRNGPWQGRAGDS